MYKREKNEKIIDELLKKMTLSEKIGQLHQVGPSPVGGFEISPDDAEKMLSAGKITKEKYDSIINHTMLDAREDEIRAGRIGSFIGIDDADTANHLQRIAVEESRMNDAIADLEEKDAIDATGEIYKDKRFLNILLIQRVFYILDIMELICHTVPKLMSEDNAFIGFALYQFSIQGNIVITHF